MANRFGKENWENAFIALIGLVWILLVSVLIWWTL